MITKEATTIWKALNGVICVYKPADVSCAQVRHKLIYNLCSELNQMECRPPIEYVSIEGDPNNNLTVVRQPSLADDPLVVGPRYQFEDVRCSWSSYLGKRTSGVLLLGIQRGTRTVSTIRENRLTRSYRIKGILGAATENFYKDGKVVEKSTYNHVKIQLVERFLATMQAAHQKKMFELCGVEVNSEAAYELALQGPIRPANSKIPVIYGMKCVQFEPPEITIEIQCINEYEKYLMALIQEVGMKLNSTAHCTGIQCIRHSYFTVENALLSKHWTLQHIINNIEQCQSIINQHNDLLVQQNVALQ